MGRNPTKHYVEAAAEILLLDDVALNDPEFFYKLALELDRRGYELQANQGGIHGTYIHITKKSA